jgi:RNA polymerase sporulation-specific sigma factor
MDQLQDKNSADETWLDGIALKEAIEKLNEREKKIILMRFYQGKTQMEVSEEIGISQAQVSRLEKNALKNIRRNI